MAAGTQVAYSRKVAWGGSCKPEQAERATVYVFDAADGLDEVGRWLAAVPEAQMPLVAVIGPKPYEEMSAEEVDQFQSSLASLWAYPINRPSNEENLLAFVRRLLPETGTVNAMPIAPCDPPAFDEESEDAFSRAATAFARPKRLMDRFD